MDAHSNLFDNYPTRTVGYKDDLSTLAVLPVRRKEIVHIVKQVSAPAKDIKLPGDEMPIGNTRPEAPGEYPGIATQVWKQVGGPTGPQVTGLIGLPVIARPPVRPGI